MGLFEDFEKTKKIIHIMGMNVIVYGALNEFETRRKFQEPDPKAINGFMSKSLEWFTMIMN